MRARKVIGVLLLFSALILLNTCQLQFNKSAGNVALKVVVPGGMTGGGKSAPGSKSLTNGTTLTVTIMQGTTNIAQQTVSLNGVTSVDFSFSLPSSGTYDVNAVMEDASGDIFAQSTTKLTVPSGGYPVVLNMYSDLLLDVVLADSATPTPDTAATGFIPPPYTTNIGAACSMGPSPYTLTLTTVDPGAVITSVTENYGSNNYVDSHTGSTYMLTNPGFPADTITIIVTGQGGTTQTYIVTLPFGC